MTVFPKDGTSRASVLAVNAGSSSIRFAIYAADGEERLLAGKIDRIGLSGANLTLKDAPPGEALPLPASASSRYENAVDFLLTWLAKQPLFPTVRIVGHRVVHGMKRSEPEKVTPKLLKELHRIISFAPEHLPQEIKLIEAFARRWPRLLQVACFDTAFHRTMPPVARRLPIPRRYAAKGIERYGFHGISYAYLMEELERLDPGAAKGRVVLAHLGNGASLAAVLAGRSLETSMGFTPAAGLMMSTRSGDIDPGLIEYFSRTERMSPSRFQKMVTRESGLLGVSGISPDMRDLLRREAHSARAAEAVELFCYQAKKWIGSFTAALGGLDAVVFAGGIGENSPQIRSRICGGLDFLGLKISGKRNDAGRGLISTPASRVIVRVIPTDEERMIARSAKGFGD